MRVYKGPDGKLYTDAGLKTEAKKTLYPPTELMLQRVKELKDRPEFASGENLDWLYEALTVRNMLNTRGQCGILIKTMKEKIREAGGTVD